MSIREVPLARARAIAGLLEGTPYTLVGSLGAGGMSEVFVVLHGRSGRRCALKLVHEHLIEQRGVAERLEVEASPGSPSTASDGARCLATWAWESP